MGLRCQSWRWVHECWRWIYIEPEGVIVDKDETEGDGDVLVEVVCPESLDLHSQ